MMQTFSIGDLIYSIPAIIIGLTVHEFAHAYASYKYGDYLPKQNGRLTLNPLVHVDPLGVLSLLLFGFGWSKPVQVDPWIYKDRKRSIIWVSFAGPLMNLLVGFLSTLILFIGLKLGFFNIYFMAFMTTLTSVNIGLFIFNLIPIPPLDGASIWQGILSEDTYEKFNEYATWLSLLLFVVLVSGFLDGPLNHAKVIVMEVLNNIANLIVGLF